VNAPTVPATVTEATRLWAEVRAALISFVENDIAAAVTR
jgi:hypothetical protein